MAQYILASASPRRKQLLEWAEVDFEIIVQSTDETFPPHCTGRGRGAYCRPKSRSGLQLMQTSKTIIAADTIVVLNNEIIGKPKDREHAIAILSGSVVRNIPL